MRNKKYYKRENRRNFFETQLLVQDGRCALCGRRERLVIDHDHKSGYMRGLLCYKHNIALGLFEDDAALLDRAKAYLEQNNAKVNGLVAKVIDVSAVELSVQSIVNELLDNPAFGSDRARARVLAEKTGILASTAQTKIQRARKKRLTNV